MTDELSDFTKLVLARLETNPDEFVAHGRWDNLVRGLEAYATNDTESRYAKTLWPLTEHERTVMLEAYRKAYLARLHKDMLKNIVSGEDLKPAGYTIGSLSNDVNPLRAGPNVPNSVLTTSGMQQATLATLEGAFNKVYAKAEGQPVQIADTNSVTYKATNRYVLNRSQVEIARKLNMSPTEYARYAEAAGALINTGGTE